LHANLFRGICIKSTNPEAKYAKTKNLLCASNKVFVIYQAQGGVNPNPLLTPLVGLAHQIPPVTTELALCET